MKCLKDEILYVEDNQDDINLTLRALRKFNLINKIHIVKTGGEAIEFIGNGIEQLKVIILDIGLPDMDGFKVLAAVRKKKNMHKLPVVILTTDSKDANIEKGYKMGANSYIVKPIDFQKFADVVSTMGFYWLMMHKTSQ